MRNLKHVQIYIDMGKGFELYHEFYASKPDYIISVILTGEHCDEKSFFVLVDGIPVTCQLDVIDSSRYQYNTEYYLGY